MHCEYVKQSLDSYTDGSVSGHDAGRIGMHLAECADCARALAEQQDYLELMAGFVAPPAEPGMAARMLREARQESDRHQHYGFMRGFALASLMALLVVGGGSLPKLFTNEPLPLVQLGAEVRMVDIVINAPDDMQGVTLAVSVPEQLELDGYSDNRRLEWTVDLKRGANVLALPVRLRSGWPSGDSIAIDVALRHQNEEKGFQIGVQFDSPEIHERGAINTLLPRLEIKT